MQQREKFMREALKQAVKAKELDEVPVGAVVVRNGEVIARAYNTKNKNKNALLHAELEVLKKAQKVLGDWHLLDCDLYVTLEPCPMCAGACINTRLRAVYFGAYDPKAGCCGSLYNLPEDKRFNHRVEVVGGILGQECATILTEFFKSKRKGV
ncbi:MAG: tRNA adenosine(34) deaminase TadA [Clostridia bacterium]|nr:tRNA adenosine(34) deaminase TadA [Clostridia bacterium]